MDEDISAINTVTRIEKIKNFFINNKRIIIVFLSILRPQFAIGPNCIIKPKKPSTKSVFKVLVSFKKVNKQFNSFTYNFSI